MTKKKFIPSLQQQAVFDWIKNGAGNAFVEAVAGAGKTTTLEHACRQILMNGGYAKSIAFAAFNKKIATEISGRVKDLRGVEAGTFHSFGLKAWRKVHRNVRIDARRKQDRLIAELNVPPYLASFVLTLVSLAKQSAVRLYWNEHDYERWLDIVEHHDLASSLEDARDLSTGIDLAAEAIAWSHRVAAEIIDFDDMIWLPAVTNVRMWQHDWVFVDEAQDTNPARRAMVKKMLRPNGRVIFVGDRHQAIYGFTGADNDAVEQIIKEFRCTSLPLTTTYRCPKSIVEVAKSYVSHITAHESAIDGQVLDTTGREFLDMTASTLTAQDAILCRKTKPIVALAFKLIRMGIACHVEGRDIGQGLIKLATKWKVKTIPALEKRLETYRDREVKKWLDKKNETQADNVRDRVETLLVIMDGCETIKCVTDKIEAMFSDAEGESRPTLTLSTVHKSKGREWERVFILGFEQYMPSPMAKQRWEQEQETNLIYVAVTRSQRELIFLPDEFAMKQEAA